MSKDRTAASLVKAALLATALVAGVATEAIAQATVSGRVTASDTSAGLAGTVVQFHGQNNNSDGPTASATTDASGNYTSPTLPPDSYAILTQDTHGYINEIFNNIPCSATCDTSSITEIVVTNVAITGIDFILNPGGRISGTVTDSGTGLPIAGIRVNFVDPDGQVFFTSAVTNASGNYISEGGTAAGNVFAVTENSLGYQNEAYNNIKCLDCDPNEVGTAIPVTLGATTGINFALDPGGTITGTVTAAAGGSPIDDAQVSIYSSGGAFLTNTYTNPSGVYSIVLAAGTYYAQTFNVPGFQNQLYNNIPCGGGCTVTNGTAINVTASVTNSNINFALQAAAAGGISGTVTNASTTAPQSNFQVWLYSSGGSFLTSVNTNGSGLYTFSGLSSGSYYVRTGGTGNLINQLYNGVTCISCSVTSSGGSLVVVASSTVPNINFNLAVGGQISGTVTNASGGAPIQNVSAQIYNSTGTFLASFNTDSFGNYITSGLPATPATTYYVKTFNSLGFIDELFDNIPCAGCSATTGTQVTVNAGATTPGISFALGAGGQISGTVTNASGGAGIQNVSAQIYNSTGTFVGSFNTNASGNYITSGLLAGTYYLRTFNSQGFVDELYDNIPCTHGSCFSTVTSGTPISVTVGVTTTGRSFVLAAGGRISGTVTNASGGAGIQNVSLQIYNSAGSFLGSVNTNASGVYTTNGLPTGTYYVRTQNSSGFSDQLYNGFPCPGGSCTVTSGTAVSVNSPTTTSSINFVLSVGGGFTGTVTNAAGGAPLQFIMVQVQNSSGGFVTSVTTNASGGYTASGLAAGTYYARTVNGLGFADELYNNLSCNYGCLATTGTPITVSVGATTPGINFSLVDAVFTDDPLMLGVTMIKAIHITELRYRINGLRVRFSLSSYAWTDSVITPGVTVIGAQHILDLRQALAQVYAAATQTPPTYTDPSLGAGTSIKRAHVAELRAAVIAIE